jgi:SAM-dependent methyltransferase
MSEQRYVLGSEAEELERLDRQAASIERPTRQLLQASGIAPGMRALDLGTGLGHVARILGELVGPAGSVVGLDNAAGVLAAARQRTEAAGASHVTFTQGDVTTWRAEAPFDVIAGRLLLFHVADPVAVVRHHLQNLNPGGLFVAIDFDIGACRTEPPVPFAEEVIRWVREAFRAAGAWPHIGGRLGIILEDAGLTRITSFGLQPYVPARSGNGAALLAAVTRTLAPAIVQHGIATDADVDLPNLQRRLEETTRAADAVILLPTVSGAWGYSAAKGT